MMEGKDSGAMADCFQEKVVDLARSWLGTPYMHQASTKHAGTDCLGLIRGIYRELHGVEPETPPPYTPDWNERFGDEILLGAAHRHLVAKNSVEAVPGDVVIFKILPDGPAKHLGIMSTRDRFIHAYAGRSVCESWYSRWWRARMVGVFSYREIAV